MIRLAKAVAIKQTVADEMEPQEFAREVRRLAIDTYKGLTYPDVPRDELARLKHRSQALLRQNRASSASEMTRWLNSVNRAIDVRLQTEGKVVASERHTNVGKADASFDQSALPLLRLFAVPEVSAPIPVRATAR